MHGGPDGTDQFTGRFLAVHAGHWLKVRRYLIRVKRFAVVITIYSQPVHLPAARHFLLPDDRDVVLRLTGDDASATASAGSEVDRHCPLIVLSGHFARLAELFARLLEFLFGI